ncbi:DUF1534 domain-containing protein [Pseudomonas syringae]|uniref:DUF1534 domain-containing protein n=1 Tax=Pseudomonas syringae TaxID=317 RepID=A0A9Q4A7T3_PSESX|nr:DUF1534 domain-containing protein [Pseudomonas syringae]MCF5475553.1 DUF1534 domain-containing protein [Pseudomonas syringae]MCF5485445.1 DUF1534 domain-containing protein [Pseudomonas syringae]MCF5489835.1 DUF1534 domain-containing protein [Pseudomonas syringae]MCF5494167.1 DUF1534 domain-containing protein [Pseudomonas syringae]
MHRKIRKSPLLHPRIPRGSLIADPAPRCTFHRGRRASRTAYRRGASAR